MFKFNELLKDLKHDSEPVNSGKDIHFDIGYRFVILDTICLFKDGSTMLSMIVRKNCVIDKLKIDLFRTVMVNDFSKYFDFESNSDIVFLKQGKTHILK